LQTVNFPFSTLFCCQRLSGEVLCKINSSIPYCDLMSKFLVLLLKIFLVYWLIPSVFVIVSFLFTSYPTLRFWKRVKAFSCGYQFRSPIDSWEKIIAYCKLLSGAIHILKPLPHRCLILDFQLPRAFRFSISILSFLWNTYIIFSRDQEYSTGPYS